MSLRQLATEQRNPRTTHLDTMPIAELLAAMNAEDATVPDAVRSALGDLVRAVELVTARLRAGGRLVYLGAGTSGRLGLLDAAECPPTFGTSPDQVVGVIAGGPDAVLNAVEGAEDDPRAAIADLDAIGLNAGDAVVGLAASGRTPYVLAGLDHARAAGAATISVACNTGALISERADVAIEVPTGPEVLTGSTRLKAGTAQKLVCNMISTAAMVQLGKTYENLMVDVRPTNEKLSERARRIVAEATSRDQDTAAAALEAAGGSAKTAIVMLLTDRDAEAAHRLLEQSGGRVRTAATADLTRTAT